jgi:hypothetical protein
MPRPRRIAQRVQCPSFCSIGPGDGVIIVSQQHAGAQANAPTMSNKNVGTPRRTTTPLITAQNSCSHAKEVTGEKTCCVLRAQLPSVSILLDASRIAGVASLARSAETGRKGMRYVPNRHPRPLDAV